MLANLEKSKRPILLAFWGSLTAQGPEKWTPGGLNDLNKHGNIKGAKVGIVCDRVWKLSVLYTHFCMQCAGKRPNTNGKCCCIHRDVMFLSIVIIDAEAIFKPIYIYIYAVFHTQTGHIMTYSDKVTSTINEVKRLACVYVHDSPTTGLPPATRRWQVRSTIQLTPQFDATTWRTHR